MSWRGVLLSFKSRDGGQRRTSDTTTFAPFPGSNGMHRGCLCQGSVSDAVPTMEKAEKRRRKSSHD